MVHSVIGQVAADSNFFDRVSELAALRSESVREQILLLAPRRVGKTSLLHRLKGVLEAEEGMHAVYASVQGATSELDFLRAIFEAAADHPAARGVLSRTGPLVKRILGRVRELEVGAFAIKLDETKPGEWQERARELSAGLMRLPGHFFLLVDELPVFVARLIRDDPTHTGQRARAFLEWFRSVRQKRPGEDVALHWVLAGSIGLDTIAHRHGLSDTINDLKPFRLGAFAPDTARTFLAALGEGEQVPMSSAVISRLLELAGWPIPHHLQVLFGDLHARYREMGRAPTVADVDAVFEGLLKQHGYFDSWYERLGEELGELSAGHARALLAACAQDPSGMSKASLDALLSTLVGDAGERERQLRFLLDVLENDGYLHTPDGRFAFRSNLLREFWKRRYV
jgi:hypothetical protein